MATDPGRAPPGARHERRVRVLLAALVVVSALAAGGAGAQVMVGSETRVHSIRFRYLGRHVIPASSLRAHMSLRAPGAFDWLRGLLSWIPLLPAPAREGLDPLVLQRDVARMRRFYQEAGFPEAQIRYRVRKDETRDRVDITFAIREGPPLLIRSVRFLAADDSTGVLAVAPADSATWESFRRAREPADSARYVTAQLVRLQSEVQDWWESRGHPFTRTTVVVDTAGPAQDVRVRVAPGPRAVIGEIQVTGDSTIDRSLVRRVLGLRPGELASSRTLARAERQMRGLEAVRGTVVEVPQDQPHDSVVTVAARLTEADQHVVSGEAGYVTDAGVSSEVSWTNRNFLRGARTFALTLDAQTGLLSPVTQPEIIYRATVSLRQPAVINPRFSLVVGPFVEYRDDLGGRSRKIGSDFSLIDQLGEFQNVTLKYGISLQHVYDYRFGDFAAGRIDLLTLLALRSQVLRDSIGADILSSTFGASAALGKLDDAVYPRRGFTLRPSAQVAIPSGLNAREYGRVEAGANSYLPFGAATLVLRASAGRVYPYGKSLAHGAEDPYFKFLQLRDVVFTGGGTADVRGWQDQLLGPKFPDVRAEASGDTTHLVARGYVPIGGFNHTSASVELQLPFPGFASFLGWHAFLDGGRVWTTDARYLRNETVPGQERFFYGAGAGLDVRTPAGPIRLSIGYKLNPSVVDLVNATDYLRAVLDGVPIESLPRHSTYRFAYHFSVGAVF